MPRSKKTEFFFFFEKQISLKSFVIRLLDDSACPECKMLHFASWKIISKITKRNRLHLGPVLPFKDQLTLVGYNKRLCRLFFVDYLGPPLLPAL